MKPVVPVAAVAAGIGLAAALGVTQSALRSTGGPSLPSGVMSAVQACRQVVSKSPKGFFTGPQHVHLVLTTYAKGEPIQSQGDISSGFPARALVWIVEVHANAIHWSHSVPSGYQPPARPYTDFSVVMNARTGRISDEGECRCWPLPLSEAGTVVSLPPEC
jgi:hypothetical protein